MEQKLVLKAHGKINLGLDVVRRLENGYHEVRMIMQSVELADIVTIKKSAEDNIVIRADQKTIPCDERNLAYKAAKLMKETYGISEGVEIFLEKHIPVAAGMAGGSADCAAVLKGMDELFCLGLTLEELQKTGVKLGADVPYCLMGGCALSEGIGEVLTGLKEPPECVLLLVKPDINVSTKYVYRNLKLETLERHPDIDGMMRDIENGALESLCEKLENVLESVTGKQYPVIGKIEHVMKEEGALQAVMSGSGPTVFGIFKETETARKAMNKIREKGLAREVYISGFFHGKNNP
ncbi:MAG: 4-(cytidine 5'-diphospho)-2-C-methyl-D-erythritol kinase [Lachnospiraceae bacterium]|jgi:4-diphosphocytidyl-2-C-methyl-D-erythritol kinase|nr:4-(cytidine 5'-diphospho)-2-C-methyl-D-erythritol kinase [Lachnospiraceae bacterium]